MFEPPETAAVRRPGARPAPHRGRPPARTAVAAVGLVLAGLWLAASTGNGAATRSAAATADLVASGAPRLLGNASDPARDAALHGDHAVMAIGGDLAIIDIADPDAPEEVARLPLGLAVNRVLVRGDRAYAAGYGAVWVVDVADPLQPGLLGTALFDASAVDLAFAADRLFVLELPPEEPSAFDTVLRVFDVADPAHPRDLGRARGVFSDVDAHGDLVVATRVVSSSGPTWYEVYLAADLPDGQPTTRVGGDLQVSYEAVAIDGSLAYAIVGIPPNGERLMVFDVSDPAQLRRLSETELAWWPPGGMLAAYGTRVLIADAWRLGVIDASDPAHPEEDERREVDLNPRPGRASMSGGSMGFSLDGDTLVHVSGDTGLAVLALHDGVPERRGRIDTPLPIAPIGLAYAGDAVFVADNHAGVVRVDVADPAAPFVADRHPLKYAETAVAIAAANERVFAVLREWQPPFGGELAELDPAAPGLPVRATIPYTSSAQSLVVQGEEVFVGGSGPGLVVVDAPQGGPLGKRGELFADARGLNDLAVVDDVAYISNLERGLVIVDVADADAPRELSSVALPGLARRLEVAGSHVYIVWVDPLVGIEHVSAIDVSDVAAPGAPMPIDLPPGALHVDADGGCLYGIDDGALRVFDIRQPMVPRQIGELPNLPLEQIVAGDGYLYAASNSLGFVTLAFDCPDPVRVGGTVFLPFGGR